jgi:CDP-glycerol glycerophosphotransferase (TagB/SpsB family)
MKIGFLARSTMILEGYYNKLENYADCWWGINSQQLNNELKEKGYGNIAYNHENIYLDKNKSFGNQYVTINPGESENVIAKMINPDLWISETLNKLNYVPKKTFWVQTFHSLPLKKHFFYPPLLEYDLILIPGEYHKSELAKRLSLKDTDERLKVIGWPKIDNFFNCEFDRDQIMNNLGLDIERKTLMYAPTWGWGYGNERLFARNFGPEHEIFEALCHKVKEMELNFIVNLHSLSFHANNKELINIANKYGVKWMTKEISGFQIDPSPFLWITDILISDLSGIITDFMVLDRPIIYIDPDEDLNAWDDSDMPKSFRVGHVASTLDQIINAVDDSIRYPERYKEQRQKLCSNLFYKLDGKATERGAQAIMNFAEDKGLE